MTRIANQLARTLTRITLFIPVVFSLQLLLLSPVISAADSSGGGDGSSVTGGKVNRMSNGYGRFGVAFPLTEGYPEDASCAVTPIAIGQQASGTLPTGDCRSTPRGSSYYAARYAFNSEPGQRVTITLDSTSLDNYLYVLNSEGRVVAEDWAGGGLYHSRLFFNSPGGTYTIEVTTHAANAMGDYTLSLRPGNVFRGVDNVGLYDPANSVFYLHNASNGGGANGPIFPYGPAGAGWVPVSGNWDAYHSDTTGLYDPFTSTFYLLPFNQAGQQPHWVFSYGPVGAGWMPITGDWDGDGRDTVGLYDPANGSFFLKNSHSNGTADVTFFYGPGSAGWIPVAGDWDGDQIDTIGLYDPVNGAFYLRNSNSTGVADAVFFYGPANLGWLPLAGDWNNDGATTVGLYNPINSTFFLKNTNSAGPADIVFNLGPGGAGWRPFAGDWDNF